MAFTHETLAHVRDIDAVLATQEQRLELLPQTADIKHALIKIASARRGLDDVLRKEKP
jgi:hypothetical protein